MFERVCFAALHGVVWGLCELAFPRSVLPTDCHASSCGLPTGDARIAGWVPHPFAAVDARTDVDGVVIEDTAGVLGPVIDSDAAIVDNDVDCWLGLDEGVDVGLQGNDDGGLAEIAVGTGSVVDDNGVTRIVELATGTVTGVDCDGVTGAGVGMVSESGGNGPTQFGLSCAGPEVVVRPILFSCVGASPFSEGAGDKFPTLLLASLTATLFFRFLGGRFFLSTSCGGGSISSLFCPILLDATSESLSPSPSAVFQ